MAHTVKRRDGSHFKTHVFTRCECKGTFAYSNSQKLDVVTSPSWGNARFDVLMPIDVEYSVVHGERWHQEVA